MHEDTAAAGFSALGNTTRLAIFRMLVRAGPEGYPIGDIQRRTGVPLSTLAHHLSMLVKAGLVSQERHGREVICRAAYPRMNALIAYLKEKCCAGDTEAEAKGTAKIKEAAGP